jgi:hypothetical protein
MHVATAARDMRAEAGAANVEPICEIPIHACGWSRDSRDVVGRHICGTRLAAYVHVGSLMWGKVATPDRCLSDPICSLYFNRIEQKDTTVHAAIAAEATHGQTDVVARTASASAIVITVQA